jgi:hypothetical protein
MVHWYVWDNYHRLTIQVNFMVKCVCYIGLGSNDCFMTDAALMGGHYRIDIINGVRHPMSDLDVPLVLYTLAYNIWGTGVILQIP